MNLKRNIISIIVLAFITLSFFHCKTKEESVKNGKIVFKFNHLIDNQPITYDTTMYINKAGNHYQVNDIQYFITDVTLHNSDGTSLVLDEWTDYKYVDVDIPSTLEWDVFDVIPEGSYSKISFTFGWTEAKNKSFMFVNPPEVNMVWPEYLGGGYHYLKINCKWIDTTNYLSGCAWHLGTGQ
ncbi:MAG: hypothetical protein K9J13_09275, partial [Saprospiraceae bacterium]|nr:hypothetical protein [Saprospiraceae bacterium]